MRDELRDRLFLAAEIEAERLLAVIRLIVAVLLASTLGAALLAMDGLPFEARRQVLVAFPVLSVYLAAGVLSYRLATPERFRGWMPWLFTVADGGLVLFNVAMTVINLGAPASSLWLFPATWLAPLVLAFGTLRYRPSLQAASGVLLVGGFAVLLALLPDDLSGLPAIVPLLEGPPTLVRLVMLALLAVVLVLAAARRRALLERAIDEAGQRANLARYLPPEIADLLARGDALRLRQGWEVEVAVLVVDIRGFTSRVERFSEPAEVSTFLGRFRGHVIAAAEASGGVVDKFVGDSAIVVFGVPEARGDEAARALACARSLSARIAAWNAAGPPGGPVRIGMGAHVGPVYAGAVGDSSRLEFTVLGDAVNVAARLEQATKESGGGLAVSRDLLERAGKAGAEGWRRSAKTTLRGRTAPIEILLWDAVDAGNP